MLALDPKTTALVLIDLQKGILARQLAPYTSAQVLENSTRLAARFRAVGAPVVLVNVGWSKDFGEVLRQTVDAPNPSPNTYPANFSELAEGLAQPGDIRITKRQWGAFYGTDLDLQLRRRGVQAIVLGGIATNMGVESTARQAWEHGYELVMVEDLSSTFSIEMQDFAFSKIFPRIGRVGRSDDLRLDGAR